ncbi:MAG: sigma-70 family RNA polymerase sigma factor [Mycobacteriales bacterium]
MAADQAAPDQDQTLTALAPLVRRVLAERGVSHPDLDDITQDCMVHLLQARRRLIPASLVAYAVVVARNAATSHIRATARRRQHLHLLVDMRVPPEPPDHAVHGEEAAALAAALAQLDPADRSALLAHELDGASTAALADAAGTTPGGVATSLARTRARARVEYLLALTG